MDSASPTWTAIKADYHWNGLMSIRRPNLTDDQLDHLLSRHRRFTVPREYPDKNNQEEQNHWAEFEVWKDIWGDDRPYQVEILSPGPELSSRPPAEAATATPIHSATQPLPQVRNLAARAQLRVGQLQTEMSRVTGDNMSNDPRSALPSHQTRASRQSGARQIERDFLQRAQELLTSNWIPSFPIDINTGLPQFSITISTQEHHTAFFGSSREPCQGYLQIINRRLSPALKLRYIRYADERHTMIWIDLRKSGYEQGYDLKKILDAAAKIMDGLKEWSEATDQGGRLTPISQWGGSWIEDIMKKVQYPPARLNVPWNARARRGGSNGLSNRRGSAPNRRAASVSLPEGSSVPSRRTSHIRASSSVFPEVRPGPSYLSNNWRARRIPDNEDTDPAGDITVDDTGDRKTDGEGDIVMKDFRY